MPELDLDAIRPWLAPCGPCDAGLPMDCSHPVGDYRSPMALLVDEVKRLRAEIAEHRRTIRGINNARYSEGEADDDG